MKKILTLLIIAFTFAACGGGSDADYIVGTWKVKSFTLNGTTSEDLDVCDANSVFIFHSNGRFQSTGAQTTPEGESCMFTWASKWKKEADYYLVYEQTEAISYHARLTKINNDSILVESIANTDPALTKILVRQ